MSKVYAVSDGQYSDYHIVATFSTREKAETFAKHFGYPEECVEEFALDPMEEEIREGYAAYFISMSSEGDTLESRKVAGLPDRYEPAFVYWSPQFKVNPLWSEEIARREYDAHIDYRDRTRSMIVDHSLPKRASWTVLARDEKHAIKIANERRAQSIANGDLK